MFFQHLQSKNGCFSWIMNIRGIFYWLYVSARYEIKLNVIFVSQKVVFQKCYQCFPLLKCKGKLIKLINFKGKLITIVNSSAFQFERVCQYMRVVRDTRSNSMWFLFLLFFCFSFLVSCFFLFSLLKPFLFLLFFVADFFFLDRNQSSMWFLFLKKWCSENV